MLNPFQISRQVADFCDGKISLEEFERWFRSESRDFLAWADARLQSEVFAVEGVLSDYRFDGLQESNVAGELAAAIRPFDPPSTSNIALVPAGLQVSWKFDQPIIHRTSESDNSLLFLGSDAPVVYIDFSPQAASREWLNVVVGQTWAWGTAGSANNNSALPERKPPQMETAPWRAASMYPVAAALVQS